MIYIRSLMITLVFWGLSSSFAYADITVSTTNRGSANLLFQAYSDRYEVWGFGSNGTRFEVARNYHVFDLSGLSGTVTEAKMTFFHPGENGNGTASFSSPDPSENITFYDVTAITSADLSNDATVQTAFNDFGDGTEYGTLTADASVNTLDATGTFQTITLNASALADIQAAINAGDEWLIGGRLTTFQPDANQVPGSNPNANERVFRGSSTSIFPNLPATTLTLTGVVPEPGSLAAALTIAGLIVTRHGRRPV